MIENAVQENGGIAYGYDFEYAPVKKIYRT